MQGCVYQLQLAECDGGEAHPHVVVLTFSGNKDCIVVPAYSKEGFKVNEYIEAMKKLGYRDGQIFVELDNAVHVKCVGPNSGKVALWLPSPLRRVAQSVVKRSKLIGQMDDGGLHAIVECILSATNLIDLSPSAMKQLRHLSAALAEKIVTRTPPTPPL